MALIYEDRTKILKKMFYEVQNEVGLGRQELAYHRACAAWSILASRLRGLRDCVKEQLESYTRLLSR